MSPPFNHVPVALRAVGDVFALQHAVRVEAQAEVAVPVIGVAGEAVGPIGARGAHPIREADELHRRRGAARTTTSTAASGRTAGRRASSSSSACRRPRCTPTRARSPRACASASGVASRHATSAAAGSRCASRAVSAPGERDRRFGPGAAVPGVHDAARRSARASLRGELRRARAGSTARRRRPACAGHVSVCDVGQRRRRRAATSRRTPAASTTHAPTMRQRASHTLAPTSRPMRVRERASRATTSATTRAAAALPRRAAELRAEHAEADERDQRDDRADRDAVRARRET